jgi:hypothetical protein
METQENAVDLPSIRQVVLRWETGEGVTSMSGGRVPLHTARSHAVCLGFPCRKSKTVSPSGCTRTPFPRCLAFVLNECGGGIVAR